MVDGTWYDRRDPDVPCPLPLTLVQLGERFGKLPWELEDAPSDRLLFYLRIIGVEGEAKAAMMGLEPDEAFEYEE